MEAVPSDENQTQQQVGEEEGSNGELMALLSLSIITLVTIT